MDRCGLMIAKAVEFAADPIHGYSQIYRWGEYGDYDCSSLMYYCASSAGYNVPIGRGYTGTMRADFEAAGFTVARDCDGRNLCEYGDIVAFWDPLPVGTILLNERYHTAIIVDEYNLVEAAYDELGGIIGAQAGDQTGQEIRRLLNYWYPYGWDYALIPPEYTHTGENEGDDTTGLTVEYLARGMVRGDYGNEPYRTKQLLMLGYNENSIKAAQALVNIWLA